LSQSNGHDDFAFNQRRRTGERHGQRRAKRQSGSQEAQEAEDQDNCRGAKPKDRVVATELRFREEEIATLNNINIRRATVANAFECVWSGEAPRY
jgi:hypothetical protein